MGIRRSLRRMMYWRDIPRLRSRVQALEHKVSVIEGRDRDVASWFELLVAHPQVESETSSREKLSSPAVTVVMPTWNRSSLIAAAIRSVQAQTFTDWELIVVDDGSTDDTGEVVAGFLEDRRVRYAAQSHTGQCAARNHALRLARGELIAYLDSDNLWYPEFLSTAVAVFSARKDVDCAYGALIQDADATSDPILFQPFDRSALLRANFIDMSVFIHRRELIERYGVFDETLGRLEDWDLILRYTIDTPAHRLPVRAARYRKKDDRRVSDLRSHAAAKARVLSKWAES